MALPQWAQLAIACSGIFLSFSYFAVLHEDLFKYTHGDGCDKPEDVVKWSEWYKLMPEHCERFEYSFYALIFERGINAAVGLLGMKLLGGSGLVIPHKEIFYSGMSQMFAMASGTEALLYVSYPVQVLGKSCKMVPVMAGGLLLGGRTFTPMEYFQVFLITLGVVAFNMFKGGGGGGSSLAPAPNTTNSATARLLGSAEEGSIGLETLGLLFIGFSLAMDAVTGGLQDKVKKSTKELNPQAGPKPVPTMHESMFWTNFSGCLVTFVIAVVTGQLFSGLNFSFKHPEVFQDILLWSLASAVGQNFIYYTITQFNPLVLTTVTTVRKIFTTVFSVLRDPSNSLSAGQWAGCGLVFFGLGIDIVMQALKPKKAREPLPPAGPRSNSVEMPPAGSSATAPDKAREP